MGERSIDQALVEQVQRGDKQAFDVLVLKYQNKIIQLVNRYVHDSDEARDVAQEAFIKAYRAIGRFRGDSAFYTWLYRIATGLREYATPERLLQKDEIQDAVAGAIDALPDDLRTAITLRELEGLSYEEIAQTMDCPIGTVRSRIFRARDAIDTRLKPLLD
jgi:RNA polymerase sigma-70 factor (ECF subfamily)